MDISQQQGQVIDNNSSFPKNFSKQKFVNKHPVSLTWEKIPPSVVCDAKMTKDQKNS